MVWVLPAGPGRRADRRPAFDANGREIVCNSSASWSVEEGVERERIAIGDTETIYRRLYPGLVRLAFLLTGSAEEAHDLTHDVFVRVAGRLETLDDPDRYLRVSLVNAARSAHRHRVVAERHRRAGPEDLLVDLELIEFRDALQLLPERQRIAIVLRYQYGESDEEIAGALGCRRSTVRSLVKRGLQQLREALS